MSHARGMGGMRWRWWVGCIAGFLAGCAPLEPATESGLPRDLASRPDGRVGKPWAGLDADHVQRRIEQLLPASLKDKSGWASDLRAAFVWLEIPHATETYCAVLAVVEQESGYRADPSVPNLPAIVNAELDRRAERYGIPKLIVTTALRKTSPDGRSYLERINALKTEKQLSDLFNDMIRELPFGEKLLSDYNPVHTGGPMQVGIDFAERFVKTKPYPYALSTTIRDEVFTRRGGLYFGSAILLDYPAPYDSPLYRFADFNAGRYASRNAAFQAALARWTGKPLAYDGDLLRYLDGKPTEAPGQTEQLLRGLAGPLRMEPSEIRRDLSLEKTAEFAQTTLYARVFALADTTAGKTLPRQAMPDIALNSPKITRKLTTAWFAERVQGRYRACLDKAPRE